MSVRASDPAIKNNPLLSLLEPQALEALIRGSKEVSYRAKRSILREGDTPDHAYFLIEGAVRVFHQSSSGTECLLKLFRGPALFGEMEVMTQRCFLEHVTTLESSKVLLIPAALFLSVLDGQPQFAKALAYDLAGRLCIAADNIRALAFSDVEHRLANVMMDYAELFGSIDSAGVVRLSVPLSQENIANDLSVTRKALGIALTRFKKQGVLAKEKGRYVIRDLKALKQLATRSLSMAYDLDRGPRGLR